MIFSREFSEKKSLALEALLYVYVHTTVRRKGNRRQSGRKKERKMFRYRLERGYNQWRRRCYFGRIIIS
jgi:hypothetical protein